MTKGGEGLSAGAGLGSPMGCLGIDRASARQTGVGKKLAQ